MINSSMMTGLLRRERGRGARKHRDREPLPFCVYFFYTKAITHLHRPRALRVDEAGGELYRAAVADGGDDPAAVPERNDGGDFGEEEAVEGGARLALKTEDEVPDRPDEEPLDEERGDEGDERGEEEREMRRVEERVAERAVEREDAADSARGREEAEEARGGGRVGREDFAAASRERERVSGAGGASGAGARA
jgi:hypothetical protein